MTNKYHTAMSIHEALLKSNHPICVVLRSAISLQASVVGRERCTLQAGAPTDLSGPQAFLANHSHLRESRTEPPMNATSGPSLNALSASADLQRSLVSRLQANLHGLSGSPEYVWTSKHWDIPQQPSIFALRARARSEKDGLCVAIRPLGSESSSEHPTSDNGFTGSQMVGWITPVAADASGGPRDPNKRLKDDRQTRNPLNMGNYKLDLKDQVGIVGWGTPSVQDCKHGSMSPAQMNRDPNVLHNQVYMTGWPTPIVNDVLGSTHCYGPKKEGQTERDIFLKLPGAAKLAPMTGWSTPQAADPVEGARTRVDSNQKCLGRDMNQFLVDWSTPGARDHKDTPGMSATGVNPDGSIRNRLDQLGRQVGLTNCSPAETAKPAALNPRFSGWLMGYPVNWCQAAIKVTRRLSKKTKGTK